MFIIILQHPEGKLPFRDRYLRQRRAGCAGLGGQSPI